MAESGYLLAIDQGTTSSRALAFSLDGTPLDMAQQEFTQHYPADGWVEHDAQEIWQTTVAVCGQVISRLKDKGRHPLAIGITNQRETTVLFDRRTGEPVAPAIVWQDRRTADACARLKDAGHEDMVTERTGLLLDPYFSASKIAWLLESDPILQERALKGDIAFGTIDSYLLFRLTGGRLATDATNASRTMLYNIHEGRWDDDLLALFDVPKALLGEVIDCAGDIATTDPALFGAAIPITGMAGDQQSAAIGQGCVFPGMVKSTYGTGCFLLENTGGRPARSNNRLLTTVASQLNGDRQFAVEGSIFMAGAAVQWLRDGLGIIGDAAETGDRAAALPDNGGVYVVPAYTGLGAPHWRPDVRGTITGLTQGSGPDHIIRATLEGVAYQTADLLQAMADDGVPKPTVLRVDGGMVRNNWFCQFLADILNMTVDRPVVTESTAFGAAFLAGLGGGYYEDLAGIESFRKTDRVFDPIMSEQERENLLAGWRGALGKALLR